MVLVVKTGEGDSEIEKEEVLGLINFSFKETKINHSFCTNPRWVVDKSRILTSSLLSHLFILEEN